MKNCLVEKGVKMKAILFLIAMCLVGISYSKSQKENPQIIFPAFEYQRKGDNALDTFRFYEEYRPMSLTQETNLAFRKNKRTVVFFFSAVCGHCRKTIPKLLEIREFLAKNNMELVAIATGNNKDEDIYKFISEYQVDIPVFKDEKRKFARHYGTGYVPVVLVINEEGLYFRINPFYTERAEGYFKHIFSDENLFSQE